MLFDIEGNQPDHHSQKLAEHLSLAMFIRRNIQFLYYSEKPHEHQQGFQKNKQAHNCFGESCYQYGFSVVWPVLPNKDDQGGANKELVPEAVKRTAQKTFDVQKTGDLPVNKISEAGQGCEHQKQPKHIRSGNCHNQEPKRRYQAENSNKIRRILKEPIFKLSCHLLFLSLASKRLLFSV